MKNVTDTITDQTGYQPHSVKKIYRANKVSKVRYWFWGVLFFLVHQVVGQRG